MPSKKPACHIGRIRSDSAAYVFTVTGGTITVINRVANPERLRDLEPVMLGD